MPVDSPDVEDPVLTIEVPGCYLVGANPAAVEHFAHRGVQIETSFGKTMSAALGSPVAITRHFCEFDTLFRSMIAGPTHPRLIAFRTSNPGQTTRKYRLYLAHPLSLDPDTIQPSKYKLTLRLMPVPEASISLCLSSSQQSPTEFTFSFSLPSTSSALVPDLLPSPTHPIAMISPRRYPNSKLCVYI